MVSIYGIWWGTMSIWTAQLIIGHALMEFHACLISTKCIQMSIPIPTWLAQVSRHNNSTSKRWIQLKSTEEVNKNDSSRLVCCRTKESCFLLMHCTMFSSRRTRTKLWMTEQLKNVHQLNGWQSARTFSPTNAQKHFQTTLEACNVQRVPRPRTESGLWGWLSSEHCVVCNAVVRMFASEIPIHCSGCSHPVPSGSVCVCVCCTASITYFRSA